MSSDYRPDNDATAGDPWDTAFLSDRDVSGQVPINYVPHPGVYITAACFGNGTYEDDTFKECFSNLLASEFRRFIVDVYWDPSSRNFQLCPVEIPSLANGTAAAFTVPPLTNAVEQIYSASSMSAPPLRARQATPETSTVSTSSALQSDITSNATTTSSSILPIATTISPSGTTMYRIGPYACSETLQLNVLMSVLGDYIDATGNTLQARLQYLIINIRAASLANAPTAPREPLTGNQLPITNELVNNYLDNLGGVVYTPVLLNNERENMNSSWFARKTTNNFPLLNYFTVNRLANGDIATPDGWPSENYVQLQQGWRLLVGYAAVDPTMSDYNFAGDNGTIFPPGVLQSERSARLDETGNVTSGCFYSSANNHVDQLNSSWAVSAVIDVGQPILGNAADNLTICGISPVLNSTLNNQPANVDYEAYQNFGNQALFSWASGEPKNATVAGEAADDVQWACALMVNTNAYQGHWRVADCQGKRRVACRVDNQPYVWQLSEDAVPFDGGMAACTTSTTFDVPRTGLENLYLYHHARAIATTQRDESILDGIWVNFNSLDVEDCWVTTGPNGTCPYYEDPETIRQRQILIPTIASFIVLCITALTILVKCNTNRRKSRTRKRGEGGWDYEGVPS